ncbi:unnamed protein product [Rotaria sp. Silwood2]|nr:unnamed protein product [Rotaria sp. Silwood2]CAF2860615.1 unnamed protein product [Rotaria sp. Silwood2]CAF3113718.1 unnamed protein product [Rotaria sp. Silwood2]CAF3204814.1 unnamed protein product [Rotaria sp. Silwood2]CAF4125123.1 unnamed protein product [Rotaria sp. Silwood2]
MNIDSRFSPSTNMTLSSQLISELIDVYKKRTRKQVLYISIPLGIVALIGIILFGVSYALPQCKEYIRECPTTRTTLFIVGISLGGTFAFAIPLVLCVWRCQMCCELSDLDTPESRDEAIVWRFDGEEWIRYLNYIHGPDRQWTDAGPLSSFCCRRGSYERLSNRQYGHIVFYRNGFIIDELHFISFETYSLLGIELQNFGQQPSTVGLRFRTYLQAGRNSRNVDFHLFAPSSVTRQQLVAIGQWYNPRISGSNGLNMALGGLQVAASVIQLAN